MSLFARRYHALLMNPPYIVPPTHEASEAYRARYESAHRRFGMGAPFTERSFELLVPEGFVAQITSNAFMKREYGAPLVDTVLPRFDLHLIADTSGCYIPGHGTPTVILAARNRPPARDRVTIVGSRRGEPETPRDHIGHVWNSILRGLGLPAELAPSGPTPIGLVWAKALTKTCLALAKDIERAAKLRPEEAGPIAAAWITTACGLRAFDVRRSRYEGSATPDHEHLGQSFGRVCDALPFNDWFDADAGINPCWRHTITDAWSARLRAEVADVVRFEAIPREQQGRTDWIGDIYQGLDSVAVKKHAFCQTPWFVAKLLGGLSVGAALETFGAGATVLDPACGTGHLLLEAFERLFLARADPDDGAPEHTYPTCARLALSQIAGGDLNPVAAAIAEWRLMLAYLDHAQPRHLGLVPDDLPIHVEVGDALLTERPEGYRPPAWVVAEADAAREAKSQAQAEKKATRPTKAPAPPAPSAPSPEVEPPSLPALAPPARAVTPPRAPSPQLSLFG